MFEWFIEVVLILVILVQYYFSKKRAELEPSESNETSRDIVVCKTGKGELPPGLGEPGPGPGELPDQVRESSRTGFGTAPKPGPGQLSARPGMKETSLLLTAGR